MPTVIQGGADKLLDRSWIAAHIPHQGSMCLLDRVREHDAERIVCCTSSHRSADNPLRAADRLGVATGIEYAAQAMAVHCALLADAPAGEARQATQGYIAAIRGVTSHVDRLDDLSSELEVLAERQSAMPGGAMYAFRLMADGRELQSGRVTLMFETFTPPGEEK